MDSLFLAVAIYLLWMPTSVAARDVFRISRQKAIWRNARDQCSMFGGKLAHLENLERFRNDVLNKRIDVIVDRGMELWVGATLVLHGWKWQGKRGDIFHEDAHTYDRRGCFKQQHWHSGVRLENISPITCLTACNWQGIVGLKKDYCMCEADLKNIPLTQFGICNLRCTGSQRDMCGGVRGVSVYQKGQASDAVTWATGEPMADNDCVFLRKSDNGEVIELISAKCQLQMRYLCHFEDEKCGVESSCIRWSTTQSTWSDAAHNCHMLGGFFAELSSDNSDNFPTLPASLPPGSFWLSLRRYRSWEWTNGNPVFMADFYTSERAMKPNHACAVLSRVGDTMAFAAKPCSDNSYYLCKYDSMHTTDTTQLAPSGAPYMPPGDHSSPDRKYNITHLEDKWPYAVLDVAAVSGSGDTDNDDDSESSDTNTLLNTCMYVILGFLSGMVFVLIVGLVVYVVYRLKNPANTEKKSSIHRDAAGSVRYTTNNDSVRISQPRSGGADVTYDSVYDLEGESPFRRTQRLIRMGSATSWRQPPPRRERSDTGGSSNSRDYTWRGMIGGKMEIINTQLRNSDVNQSIPFPYTVGSAPSTYERNFVSQSRDGDNYPTSSVGTSRRFPGITIQTTLPQSEGNYDLVGPSSHAMAGPTGSVGPARTSVGSTGSGKNFTFLELQAKTDELSQEENIYATIKKTFDKLKDDMREKDADMRFNSHQN